MTTFIKTKFKISDLESPSNFQVKEEKKYSNRSIKKEIGLLWSSESFGESTISDLESPSNFQVKEKNIQIGPETTKLDFCGPGSHLGKVQYQILNPHQISKTKKRKLFKSVQKQRNYALIKNSKIIIF